MLVSNMQGPQNSRGPEHMGNSVLEVPKRGERANVDAVSVIVNNIQNLITENQHGKPQMVQVLKNHMFNHSSGT